MDNDSTVFIGLDVHKDSIAIARVGSATTDPVIDVATIGTQQYAIDRMLAKLAGHGPLQFVYEAGPCGFWLHRYLTGKGQACMVAAPSLIPRRPGDRIKTDRRDARNLALGLRAGTLTAVHIPSPAQAAFRDVVRAWQQSKRDVAKGKQRMKAFLLRNDLRYAGTASWSAAQQVVFQELVDTITECEARRSRFEAQMAELAPSWSGYPAAQALLAFRGVQPAVAYGVAAEAGDFARFSHPRRFMAWLGLVPSEHSSGGTRRQGGITKTGNRWARTLLVEAAWAYRHTPKVSAIIETRAQQIDPAIRAIAWKAQLRLTSKYRRMQARGKQPNIIVTAIARELAGFLWDAARLVQQRN